MPNADRNDNGIKKKKIGLISKKNHFGRAAHFFVHFFTIFFFMTTTRNFLVTCFMGEINVACAFVCLFVCIFLLLLIFTLVAASISNFLTTTIKFPCNKIRLLCLMFFSSSSSSFSVIHVSVYIKIKLKNQTQLCCCFFSLNVQVAM